MGIILFIAILSSVLTIYLCFCQYLDTKANIYSDSVDTAKEALRSRVILGLIAILSLAWSVYLTNI